MAKELSEQLTRLGHKAELLLTRYGTLRAENEQLRTQVEELKVRINAAEATSKHLADELHFLRMSSALAPTGTDAREARALISDLVREIDACVADLMKDI